MLISDGKEDHHDHVQDLRSLTLIKGRSTTTLYNTFVTILYHSIPLMCLLSRTTPRKKKKAGGLIRGGALADKAAADNGHGVIGKLQYTITLRRYL